ncbi:SURF1 family cytochrome oxidase biogenesis protein [Ornithinimicrobium cryptoxanthini]|uniref:SURF1-like protein n=1 Tax=Ornithinimicrobium cryptoxanthini TaxID=2934161 RepID=A0ABY4YEX0_9MICO|nr:SURF1 family protein [Ornithinimicrobium cryptoxanthini]USQ74898.1 SURF1 family protein [Ornithinimicrobium cryptoxanthini]
MLRTLLTRRWLTALALALIFAVVAVLLGNWQFSRHQERVAARDLVESHYDAAPVPLEDVLRGDAPLASEREWTRVQTSGEYVGEQLFVRNRPREGTFGYEVVAPLQTAVGTLTVNRGWGPNAENAATLPDVPTTPEGPVEVTGWLRPGEVDLDRAAVEGQLASINLAAAGEQWQRPVLGAYLVLESEQHVGEPGRDIARPLPLEPPRTGLGAHFAYSLQWWLTSPVGLILVLVMARREWQDTEAGAGTARPAKAKKVRIWDEEDE